MLAVRLDKVRSQEQKLGSKVSVSQTRIEETVEEDQDRNKVKKLLKKIRENTQDRNKKPSVFQERRETLGQDAINNIFDGKDRNQGGIEREIIKQLIRNKLEEAKVKVIKILL